MPTIMISPQPRCPVCDSCPNCGHSAHPKPSIVPNIPWVTPWLPWYAPKPVYPGYLQVTC